MDQASPDLLLMIFKELNSKEMVSVMRVEKKWLQIIDENKALWRELVLPSNEKGLPTLEKGWGLQTLEMFDQKSNSTLKKVSMDVAEEVESKSFVEILEKSKDTLRVLELEGRSCTNFGVREALEENLWKFPKLVDCRLTSCSTWYYELRLQLLGRNEDQVGDKGSSLRVLWISDSEKLIKSHLYLLDNLVSLLFDDEDYNSSEMRSILERPSRTLKHLQINIDEPEQPQLPTLSFPNLEFLDIYPNANHFISDFPSWMSLPSLSTLFIHSSWTLSSLPACSRLWLTDLIELEDLSKLASQCPELVELKLDLDNIGRGDEYGGELSAWERIENLSSMLSQRKVNVEDGMEIGGVKMINLETLQIDFMDVECEEGDELEEVGLSKLAESVEEVVNLRGAGREIIEMEV